MLRDARPSMKYVVIIIIMFIVCPCTAQRNTTEKAIMKPIELLFEAMHRGDSAMARKVFSVNPTITTVMTDNEGNTVLRADNFEKFMNAIGTPHQEPWSEKIWGVEIRSADNLATAWMNYAFYVGKRFSHCGVDAFQLVRETDGQWRIFFIADTRKTTDCRIPPEIDAAFRP